jgi:hypothetical protein
MLLRAKFFDTKNWIIVFVLISQFCFAQPDSVRYDKWIGWITPTSGLHAYHPAIEVGAEYNPGNQWAYVWNYGVRVTEKRDLHYSNQSHQYLRFGLKRYFNPKFNSGYIMPEVGFFHLSHKGHPSNVGWNSDPENILPADARFHDFYLKTGAILGRKMKAGGLRFDLFTGGGVRFTFRNHKLLNMADSKAEWMPCTCNTMFSSNEIILINTPKGWISKSPNLYLSLGIRVGLGFKPVVLPKS